MVEREGSGLERFEVRGLRPGEADQRAWFRELTGIPGVWVYLHGSRADGTATAFSDYDDLVVVDHASIHAAGASARLRRSLRRVERRLQRLDPLQHHGHWLVTRESLDRYDAGYLPPWALSGGRVISGPPSLEGRIDLARTRKTLESNADSACRGVEALFERYQGGRLNAYSLKKLVGLFALVPAYVLQHAGERVDKAEALGRSGEIYSPRARECVAWSTHCRSTWHRLVLHPLFRVYRSAAALPVSAAAYRRLAARFGPVIDPASVGMAGLHVDQVRAFVEETRARIHG